MARNPVFWKHYSKDVRMKYIFFVQDGKVTRIPFAAFLRIAKPYAAHARSEKLAARRSIAEDLLRTYL
jgi:hypothetical protein